MGESSENIPPHLKLLEAVGKMFRKDKQPFSGGAKGPRDPEMLQKDLDVAKQRAKENPKTSPNAKPENEITQKPESKLTEKKTELTRPLSVTESIEELASIVGPEADMRTIYITGVLKQYDWTQPHPEQWGQIRLLMNNLPTEAELTNPDEIALIRNLQKTVSMHYYEHFDAYKGITPIADLEQLLPEHVTQREYGKYKETFDEREREISEGERQRRVAANLTRRLTGTTRAQEVDDVVKDLAWDSAKFSVDEGKSRINELLGNTPSRTWLTDLANSATTPEEISFLASVASAGPDALEDPKYLYMKAAQFRLKNEQLIRSTSPNDPRRTEVNSILEKFRKKIDSLSASGKLVTNTRELDEKILEKHINQFETYDAHNIKSDKFVDEKFIEFLENGDDEQKHLADFFRSWNRQVGNQSEIDMLKSDPSSRQYQMRTLDLFDEFSEEYYETFSKQLEQFTLIDKDAGELVEKNILNLCDEGASYFERHFKERGWSDLYLSPRIVQRLLGNTEYELYKYLDKKRLHGQLYDTKISQAMDRTVGQMANFIASGDFTSYLRNHFFNRDNYKLIEKLSNEPVPSNFREHSWYQKIASDENQSEFVRRVSHLLSNAESLQAWESQMNAGSPFDKMKPTVGNLSDQGIHELLNERNGMNRKVYAALERVGNSLKWSKQDGLKQVVSGQVLEEFQQDVLNELMAERDVLNPMFKVWSGTKDLTELDLKFAIKEMQMLRTVTWARARNVADGLTPFEDGGADGPAFARQISDYAALGVIDGVRFLYQRWDLVEDKNKPFFRRMGLHEAARQGIDKEIHKQLLHVKEGTEEFFELAKKEFNIRGNASESAQLGQLDMIKCGKRGYKGPDANPKKVQDLTKKDLEEYMVWKRGFQMATPRLMCSWNYQDSGWVNDAYLQTFADKDFAGGAFVDNKLGLGLHERLRKASDGLVEAGSHKDLHDAHRELVGHVNKEGHMEDGLIDELAKYDPTMAIDAFMESGTHAPTEAFVRGMANESNIYNQVLRLKKGEFHDKAPLKEDLEIPLEAERIKAERWDLQFARSQKRVQLLNMELAEKKLDWFDYSKSFEEYASFAPDSHEGLKFAEFNKVCEMTGVDGKDFLRLMNKYSKYVREQKNDLANPLYIKHFQHVRTQDPRTMYSEQFADKSKNFSRIISGEPSVNTGIARMAGDAGTVQSANQAGFDQIMQATDYKTYRESRIRFFNTARMSGGKTAKQLGTEVMDYAWLTAARRFSVFDWLGMGGEASTIETSEFQVASGLSMPTLTLNEVDHYMHDGEADAGTKWHRLSPHVAHIFDKEAGLTFGHINVFPKFVSKGVDNVADSLIERLDGKHPRVVAAIRNVQRFFHSEITLKTLWAYRLWALGLLGAAIFAAGAYDNAKKGASGQSGGGSSSGGGHEAHGGH